MAVPALAPIVIYPLACPTCGAILRQKVVKQNNGKLTEIRAFCDTKGCEYGWKPTLQHAYGEAVKYEAPGGAPRIEPTSLSEAQKQAAAAGVGVDKQPTGPDGKPGFWGGILG